MTESTNILTSGVNREEAKSIIEKFLKNKDYKVLAVKGKWGVGKTYLVQNFLSEYKTIKYQYFYASVFGISSIEQLKARILANAESTIDWLKKPINNTVESINRNFARVEKTPKLDFGLSGTLVSIAGDLLLEALFNFRFKIDSIICIDDLERKSKLPLEDILGFVEYLVQEFKCKIILIYNDEEFTDQDSRDTLKKYREKVIDKEFKLDPTVEDNLNVGLEDKPDLEAHDLEIIKNVFLRSRTNNIRVIKKTKWLINEIIPLMKDWEDNLRHQIIRNAIIINLAKLDTELCTRLSINGINPFETILLSAYGDNSEFSKYDPKTLGKMYKFTEYMGYSPLDQLDKLIIHLVDTPLSNPTELEFIQKGQILNQREQKHQIVKKIRSIGQLSYYSSFADNEEEIVNEIISFLKDNHLDLSISQFEQIQRFTSILEVDISHYEKALLEKLLTEDLGLDFYNNLSIIRNKLSKYPDLEAILKDKINDYHQKLDITTALKKIINTDSQSSSPELKLDIEFLKSRTVEEYSKWLEQGHPDLHEMVVWLLQSGYQPASDNLKQAICILAECSRINKIRAKSLYNIDIDNPSNANN